MKELQHGEWQCWDILHAGEGERGESVVVMGGDASSAAEEAAEYFDDLEQARERISDEAFDGGTHYVEVVDHSGLSVKHEVVCSVVRHYQSVIR